MKVKSESEVAQLSLTLSDPMDCGPLGSSVHGIFQAGEELYKKDLHDPDNHNGVITNLEPNILECEVKYKQS